MGKLSIPRQARRAEDRSNLWRQWRRQVVAVMGWAPLLAIFSASAALAAPTVRDFEDIAAGTRITTQYSPRGVLFPNHFLGTDPAAHSGTRVLRTANPADEIFTPIPLAMTFTCVHPCQRLPFVVTHSGHDSGPRRLASLTSYDILNHTSCQNSLALPLTLRKIRLTGDLTQLSERPGNATVPPGPRDWLT